MWVSVCFRPPPNLLNRYWIITTMLNVVFKILVGTVGKSILSSHWAHFVCLFFLKLHFPFTNCIELFLISHCWAPASFQYEGRTFHSRTRCPIAVWRTLHIFWEHVSLRHVGFFAMFYFTVKLVVMILNIICTKICQKC